MVLRNTLLGILSAVLGVGCAAAGPPADTDPNRSIREALQAELTDASAPGWVATGWTGEAPVGGPFVPPEGPAVEVYRARLVKVADWTGGPVWHRMGYLPLVRSGKATERLGVNVFLPPGPPKGTLLFVHGFMSHAANFAYTYAWFTGRGWAVTTLDLPGHGFSTGPRADVDTFSTYGDAVSVWMDWVQGWAGPGPRVLMAHSLGTLAAFEALGRPGARMPDRVVFCAPLLRTDWYPLLSLGEAALGGVLKTAPTTFGWDGYLDGYAMPVHWYSALDQWLASTEGRLRVKLPLVIYSGDRDQVVDEGWNLAEYQRLVPGVREVVLPGLDHFFLSNDGDRQAVHQRIWNELGF